MNQENGLKKINRCDTIQETMMAYWLNYVIFYNARSVSIYRGVVKKSFAVKKIRKGWLYGDACWQAQGSVSDQAGIRDSRVYE
jgi:hypothetical protein